MGRKLLASTTSDEPRPASVIPDEGSVLVRKAVDEEVTLEPNRTGQSPAQVNRLSDHKLLRHAIVHSPSTLRRKCRVQAATTALAASNAGEEEI